MRCIHLSNVGCLDKLCGCLLSGWSIAVKLTLEWRLLPWQVLRLLIKLYESVESPDWVSICQCLMFLDDAAEVAKILERLIKGSEVRGRAPCKYFCSQ